MKLFIYFLFVIGFGFITNNLSQFHEQLGKFESIIWLVIFLGITFFFQSTRTLLLPLLDVKVFRNMSTYFLIVSTLFVSFLFLKLCIHFEVLLDERFIFNYKNGLLHVENWIGVLTLSVVPPIWEELLFRGIILFLLLKVVKSYIAIPIVTTIWAVFHPEYWVVTLISGLLLGYMAYKTKSLLPSIVTHSIWNLYASRLFLYF